jgi:hypothetical protein
MAKLESPRELKPPERALLDLMLSRDFPGSAELREQATTALVNWECDCGCGTVNFAIAESSRAAAAQEPIPIEARSGDVEVLLFVSNGLLSSVEIVDYYNKRPLPYPTPDSCELFVHPPAKPGSAKP